MTTGQVICAHALWSAEVNVGKEGYVGIVRRRNIVEFKYVEEIVELAMNISTHCELVALHKQQHKDESYDPH